LRFFVVQELCDLFERCIVTLAEDDAIAIIAEHVVALVVEMSRSLSRLRNGVTARARIAASDGFEIIARRLSFPAVADASMDFCAWDRR
jgi:hypothetical protein